MERVCAAAGRNSTDLAKALNLGRSELENVSTERKSSRVPKAEMFDDASMPDEAERTRIMEDIARLMREPSMPECARTAGLTFIGWLARRLPSESPHTLGVDEARASEKRVRAAKKARGA